ncbi:FGGY-family carbohydrate kinase [Cohnella candidum]|uniref:Carbohydrate kinase n=1 Tax=Cohnella candidum TaxID=2674991 RepID=A0A3G3JWG5_9BACL|nr:FGGY family carbohydrate kinase [Cohnella candidum]AYQ72191.1 carbohydrate kinase [Cohnella candidum]
METQRLLLGIDVGTTHCKAALFAEDGGLLRQAKTNTPRYEEDGFEYFDPKRLSEGIVALIREAVTPAEARHVACVGVTSMAETGLLVDAASGQARSPLLPWFSPCAKAQSERMVGEGDPMERFAATGLRGSFKYGLAKLLWLKERAPDRLENAVWLSAADYAAYGLTGAMATDYTLAARTYAYRIDRKEWDRDWIRHFGLAPALFPEVYPSGMPIGGITKSIENVTGIPEGVPVAIAGHDHVAASVAIGVTRPGEVMDSIGTAETLLGVFDRRALVQEDWDSGLSFGLHPANGRLFWMGGLSASGGSVEWFRTALSDPALSYEKIIGLLDGTSPEPTGILYFPYLSGSGAPMPDPDAKAAFFGITSRHRQADLLKAVLEGTAYEMEAIRRSAARIAGTPIDRTVVTGGGVRNRHWLQIKANVSGSRIRLPDEPETALLGAALLAGIGCGIYANMEQALEVAAGRRNETIVEPQNDIHESYRAIYERVYMPLQQPLRQYSKII